MLQNVFPALLEAARARATVDEIMNTFARHFGRYQWPLPETFGLATKMEVTMFLKDKQSGDLVRVEHLEELFDPLEPTVSGRDQAGEEEQDSVAYPKEQLMFPSGEELPRCWIDANYPRA